MRNVEIRIKGQIKKGWSEWLGGLTISYSECNETVLTGLVPDEAALYGIIARLRDLGLQLTSLSSEEIRDSKGI